MLLFMINFINKLELNRALKSYLYDLGPALIKRYGQPEQFSVMQVKKTAKDLNISLKYIPYAIAIYRHEQSENTINLYRIDQSFLDILRSEISLAVFGYKKHYRVSDIIEYIKPMGWKGGNPNNVSMCALGFLASGGGSR